MLTFPPEDLQAFGTALRNVLSEDYALSFLAFSIWSEDRGLFLEHVLIPEGGEPEHVGFDELDDYGFGHAVRTGAPRLIRDLRRESVRPGEWRAHQRFGTRSYLTLPFRINDQVAGALGLGSGQVGHFSSSDIERLDPVARLLAVISAQSGAQSPRGLEPPSLATDRQVCLVGTDRYLLSLAGRLLPRGVSTKTIPSLDGLVGVDFFPLTIYCTGRLSQDEANQIAVLLERAPRRLIIFCHRAGARTVYRLTLNTANNGFLGVEDARTTSECRERFGRLYFSGFARPDWTTFQISDPRSPEITRTLRILEGDPFRVWSVSDLAREVAVSSKTLNRRLREGLGLSTKQFLIAVRYQVVDRFRRAGDLSGEEIAELFGFPSNKAMYTWCSRYDHRGRAG